MASSPLAVSTAGLSDIAHHLHPYTQLRQLEREGPLVIVRGEGVHVFDEHGNRYLEGMAGLWCASLGFSEARLVDAAVTSLEALREMTRGVYPTQLARAGLGPALSSHLTRWGRGTLVVDVSTIGVSMSPISSICVDPASLPNPLPTNTAPGTRSR